MTGGGRGVFVSFAACNLVAGVNRQRPYFADAQPNRQNYLIAEIFILQRQVDIQCLDHRHGGLQIITLFA